MECVDKSSRLLAKVVEGERKEPQQQRGRFLMLRNLSVDEIHALVVVYTTKKTYYKYTGQEKLTDITGGIPHPTGLAEMQDNQVRKKRDRSDA